MYVLPLLWLDWLLLLLLLPLLMLLSRPGDLDAPILLRWPGQLHTHGVLAKVCKATRAVPEWKPLALKPKCSFAALWKTCEVGSKGLYAVNLTVLSLAC